MPKVTSQDGTEIAYTIQGSGPPLIYVDGALCHRGFGPIPKLAPHLARNFTFLSYDRRGRGESGDAGPYAVQREIEDLQALVDVLGGHASLYGGSSGAVLAMRAAAADVSVDRLVLYEAPLAMADAPGKQQPEQMPEIERLVAEGRRGDAVAAFMTMVGMPSLMIPMMRLMRKTWRQLEAVAHTIPYDFAVIGHASASKPLPQEIESAARRVRSSALVLDGGKAAPWMRHAQDRLAALIPDATRKTLPKQTHMANPRVIAPAVARFCLTPEALV